MDKAQAAMETTAQTCNNEIENRRGKGGRTDMTAPLNGRKIGEKPATAKPAAQMVDDQLWLSKSKRLFTGLENRDR